MSRRTPMEPPALRGYTYQRLLGSGGYSDVFLYEQEMPRRPVAIKVLLAEALDEAGRRQFTDEANTMAALSTHPFIVTIFHADVSPQGQPFLVMELYPRPNFSVRARTEQLSLASVLRTGIQVASAVETAHRAGILHRDIKPANILTSEYGRPGLTDFGIASTSVDGTTTEAEGMSIPWSPPEVINGSAVGDQTADVYSLAATVYSLLAGRSPFEVPGGSNRSLDLIERIERSDLPPTGRGDVPQSLERLLRQAMSKEPRDRPQSAADLARGLQAIEVEQHLAMTPLEVRDDGTDIRARSVDPDDGTRLKGPVVIQSQPVAPHPAPDGDTSAVAGTVQRPGVTSGGLIAGVGAVPVGSPPIAPPAGSVPRSTDPAHAGVPATATDPSSPEPAAAHAPQSDPPRHRNRLTTAALAVLVLVVALVGVRLVMGGTTDDDTGPPGPGGPVTTRLSTRQAPPPPEAVTVELLPDGSTVISWELAEGADPATTYRVLDAANDQLDESEPGATALTIPAREGATPCVSVMGVLDQVVGPPTTGCRG